MTFLAGFSKRKAIKIATAGIPSSSLTAFPKLFMISGDTDIGGETTSQKLAVTLADGVTQVPYGALSYSVSGGAATLKIRAKFDLSSSLSNGDTIGYLYYDHTATDQSNKSGVLDSNTKAYWPLEETPSGSGDMKDWSSNAFNGTATNGPTSGTGKIGNCLTFDGTNDYVALPNGSNFNPTTTTPFTHSAIINTDAIPGVSQSDRYWNNQRSAGSSQYFFWITTAGQLSVFTNGSGAFNGSTVLSATTFYHVAWVFDGSKMNLYVNGSPDTTNVSFTLPAITSDQPAAIGSSVSSPFKGKIDEVFFASVARSAAWIAYDYTDQFSNSSTFTLGAEETSGVTSGLLLRRRRMLMGAS